MSNQVLQSAVRGIVEQLVRGEYQAVIGLVAESRLTAEDLRTVIRDYGHALVLPPGSTHPDMDTVQVRDALCPTWSVRAPLWTRKEGRSDLTLELTITLDGDRLRVELDDLHVL